MIENCSEACELSMRHHNSILHGTYRNLIRDNISTSELNTDLLRPLRVEVAQPQVAYFPSSPKPGKMLKGRYVTPVLIILPKELPPPRAINHATAVN